MKKRDSTNNAVNRYAHNHTSGADPQCCKGGGGNSRHGRGYYFVLLGT